MEDWLMRIDLKYAIRFVTMTKYYCSRFDELNVEAVIDNYPRKKDKKALKDFASAIRTMKDANDSDYELVMRRKYIEQEMERTN